MTKKKKSAEGLRSKAPSPTSKSCFPTLPSSWVLSPNFRNGVKFSPKHHCSSPEGREGRASARFGMDGAPRDHQKAVHRQWHEAGGSGRAHGGEARLHGQVNELSVSQRQSRQTKSHPSQRTAVQGSVQQMGLAQEQEAAGSANLEPRAWYALPSLAALEQWSLCSSSMPQGPD
jgi:hypothetical protein